MAPVVTMRQLLESGVHFGHQTRRWNPKMKRFILTERNGIYIIDLQQSLEFIDRAYEFISETVAHGGSVLYVGTKKQAQEAIAEQARRVGMPFVNQRWLGGMLTNFSTVYKRLQRLKELEEIDFDDVAGSTLTKKELLHLRREREKLDRSLGGIRDMARVPSAIWVVDTKKEHIAVSEARKLGIPVIAILDTNCDPDEVTRTRSSGTMTTRSPQRCAPHQRVVADAVADGLIARAGAAAGEEKPAAPGADGQLGAAEPLAEWERELLEAARPRARRPTAPPRPPAPPRPALPRRPTAPPRPARPPRPAPRLHRPVAKPADDAGTHPRPGSAEAESSDALTAEPDAIDPADELPTDEVKPAARRRAEAADEVASRRAARSRASSESRRAGSARPAAVGQRRRLTAGPPGGSRLAGGGVAWATAA